MAALSSFLCFSLLLLVSSPLPALVAAAKKPVSRREDVPLIKCQVCEHIAGNSLKQAQALRRRAGKKKVSELKVLEVAERICNVKKVEGDWIQWLDIVESGDVLSLKKQPYKGECGEECKTIEKACNEVMGFSDTDVAELLHTRPDISAEEFTDQLCKGLTSACKNPIPKIPPGRKPGPEFVRKSSMELEREHMERNLEGKHEQFAEENPDAPRMPKMKLYSRDDIMKKTMMTGKQGLKKDDEDDDEDDDDDDEDAYQDPGFGGAGASSGGLAEEDKELEAISEAMRSAEAGDKAEAKKSLWDSAKEQALGALGKVTKTAKTLVKAAGEAMTSKPATKKSKKNEL